MILFTFPSFYPCKILHDSMAESCPSLRFAKFTRSTCFSFLSLSPFYLFPFSNTVWLNVAVSVWFLRFSPRHFVVVFLSTSNLLYFSDCGSYRQGESALFGASLRDCHRSRNFSRTLTPGLPNILFFFLLCFGVYLVFPFRSHSTWNVEPGVVRSRILLFFDLLDHFSFSGGG